MSLVTVWICCLVTCLGEGINDRRERVVGVGLCEHLMKPERLIYYIHGSLRMYRGAEANEFI